MAFTNQTQNLGLPQWLGSDKPNWDIDLNEAFRKIDNNAGELAEDISGVSGSVGEAESAIGSLQSEVTSVHDEVTQQGVRITTLEATDAGHSQSIAKLNSDVAGLLSSVENLQESVDADLEEVQSQVGLNTENINTANTRINNLKNRVFNAITEVGSYPLSIRFGKTAQSQTWNRETINHFVVQRESSFRLLPLVDSSSSFAFIPTAKNSMAWFFKSSTDIQQYRNIVNHFFSNFIGYGLTATGGDTITMPTTVSIPVSVVCADYGSGSTAFSDLTISASNVNIRRTTENGHRVVTGVDFDLSYTATGSALSNISPIFYISALCPVQRTILDLLLEV